jgi:protein-tyrosine kinase
MLEYIKDFDNHLTPFWKPDSMLAEQYRILRTRILETARNKENKVFLISSAVHGEGKTLTAINLALSIVKGMHETVLLIDADLRNPNIADMLGFEKDKKGLADYLTFGGDPADFITKTPIPGLSIITSGLPPENPSELINSEYMSDLIQEVKYRYDNRYIIIDSPPLLPITDSTILSSLADKVIIIVKASATQRKMVNEAIDKIKNKEKILGLVLNCYNRSSAYKYTYNYH